MTNFFCLFCEEKIKVPKEIKISPVTDRVWHTGCIDNPVYGLTKDQRIFYQQFGFEF